MSGPDTGAERSPHLTVASDDPAPRTRREEIVAAAAKFFAESGYHTVGMRDVAEAVGIRGASLYNHFRSKEDILFQIAMSVTRSSVEGYMVVLDEPGTPSERLSALLRGHVIHVAERRVEYKVITSEVKELSLERRNQVYDYTRYYQRRVRDVVMAGARAGELQVDNPRLASVALMDMLNGISGWFDPSMDAGQLADDYVRFGIGGILHYKGDIEALCAIGREIADNAGFVAPPPSA